MVVIRNKGNKWVRSNAVKLRRFTACMDSQKKLIFQCFCPRSQNLFGNACLRNSVSRTSTGQRFHHHPQPLIDQSISTYFITSPRSRYHKYETEHPYFLTCTVVDGCRSSRGRNCEWFVRKLAISGRSCGIELALRRIGVEDGKSDCDRKSMKRSFMECVPKSNLGTRVSRRATFLHTA